VRILRLVRAEGKYDSIKPGGGREACKGWARVPVERKGVGRKKRAFDKAWTDLNSFGGQNMGHYGLSHKTRADESGQRKKKTAFPGRESKNYRQA